MQKAGSWFSQYMGIVDKESKDLWSLIKQWKFSQTQPAFTCSKSTRETPEQCVKYVQS